MPGSPRLDRLRVAELTVYPLKSAAGLSLDEARLDACGIAGDRRWMVVDGDDRFVTQRERPRLALVRARDDGEALLLEAPGLPALVIARPPPGAARRSVTVWDAGCELADAGDAAAAWLGRLLDVRCRLVHRPDGVERVVDPRYAAPHDRVGLADGFPLLLVGQGSLDELNGRLAAAGQAPVPMNRFRPNIVVTGAAPFAEDGWSRLSIGDPPVEIRIVKPCARCSIVPVDQSTGIRGVEPLRTLATYRRRDGDVLFGQNVLHGGRGTLRVGDEVRIVA